MNRGSRILAAAWRWFPPAFIGWLVGLSVVSFGLATETAKADAPVQLPPMIVSDGKHARPWRFTSAPGLEVLSRCDDSITEDFVERTFRLEDLLTLVLPDYLQFKTTAPTKRILVDAESAPSMSENLVLAFTDKTRPSDPGSAASVPRAPAPAIPTALFPMGMPARTGRTVEMVPNLELGDVDEQLVFAIVDGRTFNGDGLVFTDDHLRIALNRRVPPLPAWFIAGVTDLFDEMSFGRDSVQLGPTRWLSEAETRRLREDSDAPRQLMALIDLFASGRDTPATLPARAEAKLLVRWALAEPQRRTAFWQCVRSMAEGTAPAEAVSASFGLSLSDLRDRLSDYLPIAVRDGMTLSLEHPRPYPELVVRDATAAEVGRLKGEWERLEYGHVKARYPEFAPRYLALAQETIERARNAAPDDAGVLTVAGLLACDLGDRGKARPLLEAAAAHAHARPRVYAELASLRLREMLGPTQAGNAVLSPVQAEILLQTIAAADSQQPPLAMSAALKAEVWMRSRVSFQPADFDELRRAVQRFPRFASLLYCTAVIEARGNRIAAARVLVDRALTLELGPTANAAFLALRDQLRAASAVPDRAPVAP